MTHHPTEETETRIRSIADNAFLILMSRWAAVLLIPISLTFGGWLGATVQTLVLDVRQIQTELEAQREIFENKLKTVDESWRTRMGSVEGRVSRLETIEDRRQYGARGKGE